MSTRLIAFHGKKRSGKDTAGKVVHTWGNARGLRVSSRGFADIMKLAAMRSLGVPTATNINDAVVMADSFKESGFVNFEFPDLNYANGITGREYLRYFATEGHRDVFGEDFWIDLVLPESSVMDWRMQWAEHESDFPDIAVITDLRFVNEAKRVRELGGRVIEIHRPLNDGAENHLSEQGVPRDLIDYTIENDSTLEAFEIEVNSWMTAEYHMKFADNWR